MAGDSLRRFGVLDLRGVRRFTWNLQDRTRGRTANDSGLGAVAEGRLTSSSASSGLGVLLGAVMLLVAVGVSHHDLIPLGRVGVVGLHRALPFGAEVARLPPILRRFLPERALGQTALSDQGLHRGDLLGG